MFSEKRGTPSVVGERNIIGKNTSLVGDLHSEGDFRIDGKIEGNIKTAGRVVIGKEGTVIGTIDCTNADIEGHFSGNLVVEQLLSLKESAIVNGEVSLGKLMVEPGAELNATCSMKGAIKQINHAGAESKKTA